METNKVKRARKSDRTGGLGMKCVRTRERDFSLFHKNVVMSAACCTLPYPDLCAFCILLSQSPRTLLFQTTHVQRSQAGSMRQDHVCVCVYFSVVESHTAPQLTCVRSFKCDIQRYQGCYVVEGMCHCAQAFCCNNPFNYSSLESCLANNTDQLGKL